MRTEASSLARAKCPRQHHYGLLREFDIKPYHAQDLPDIDRRDAFVPAIVIGYQHQHGVTELGLTREPRFLHRSHADHIHAPTAIELRFGTGRELRTFDAEV